MQEQFDPTCNEGPTCKNDLALRVMKVQHLKTI